MLIIDEDSVYEIDEECLKQRRVSKECGTVEKLEEKIEEKIAETKKEKHRF